MTHGWPGSVIEMLGVVGPLTDPAALGGHPRAVETPWQKRYVTRFVPPRQHG